MAMKCPICQLLGKKSCILDEEPDHELRWIPPIWNDEGLRSFHPSDKEYENGAEFWCSNGHHLALYEKKLVDYKYYKIEKIVSEISINHHKIIDDWCKAYLSQLHKEGVDIKPGCFRLIEKNCLDLDGSYFKKYWFEKIEEKEERNYFYLVVCKNRFDLVRYVKQKFNEKPIYSIQEKEKEIIIESDEGCYRFNLVNNLNDLRGRYNFTNIVVFDDYKLISNYKEIIRYLHHLSCCHNCKSEFFITDSIEGIKSSDKIVNGIDFSLTPECNLGELL